MFKLLVSVLLFAILAVGAYMQFMHDTPKEVRQHIEDGVAGAKKTHNLSEKQENLLRIQIALTDFRAQNGQPPNSLSELVPTYFDKVPIDPEKNAAFEYKREGSSYTLATEVDYTAGEVPDSGGSDEKLSDEDFEKAMAKDGDFVNPNNMKLDVFAYSSKDLRDPFTPFNLAPKDDRDLESLTPLERLDIGQLELKIVMTSPDGSLRAMVEDATGKGFIVTEGTKIGSKNGVVAEIQKDRIKILEVSVDFTGEEKREIVEMKINSKKGEEARRGRGRRSRRR